MRTTERIPAITLLEEAWLAGIIDGRALLDIANIGTEGIVETVNLTIDGGDAVIEVEWRERGNWVIVSGEGEVLWWSNENGWGDFPSATIFSNTEREMLNLPMGGKWVEVPPR